MYLIRNVKYIFGYFLSDCWFCWLHFVNVSVIDFLYCFYLHCHIVQSIKFIHKKVLSDFIFNPLFLNTSMQFSNLHFLYKGGTQLWLINQQIFCFEIYGLNHCTVIIILKTLSHIITKRKIDIMRITWVELRLDDSIKLMYQKIIVYYLTKDVYNTLSQ